jgi:hypothetical protein
MKLTKGKIARLHKTNRQSVKKQKRNKKHRNVKNLMSLNHKQSTHLANKSMKKYKKVGGELVHYGGGKPLNSNEIEEFKGQLQNLLAEVKERYRTDYNTLYGFERKYNEAIVQIFNNKIYNINTLKKICSTDVRINVFVITDDNLYMVVAMSDGRVIICKIDGTFVNSYSHDESVVALCFINADAYKGVKGNNVIISGSTDGIMKRYILELKDPYGDARQVYQTSQFDFKSMDEEIVSIISSQDGKNILVTTKKTNDDSFNMVIYNSDTFKPAAFSDSEPMTIRKAAAAVAVGTTTVTAGFLGHMLGGIPVNIVSTLLWVSILDYFKKCFEKVPPQLVKEHKTQFRIKYITVNTNKTLLAFCTDGRINILKLHPDATPMMVYLDDEKIQQVPDEIVIDNKFFDDFNVACFSPDGKYIACAAGNILSMWEINMVEMKYTNKFMVSLYSKITSIVLTAETDDDVDVFCGFSDGSIQKNPQMLYIPTTLYCWIGGHFDEVGNLYLINKNLYSSSFDGTIRTVDTSSKEKILNSTMIINSAPELFLVEEKNPFIDPGFVFGTDDFFLEGEDKTELDKLFNDYFKDEETMVEFGEFQRSVDGQKQKLNLKLNTLDRIVNIDANRITENENAEKLFTNNSNYIKSEKAKTESILSKTDRANTMRKLSRDEINLNLERQRTLEAIVQRFQKGVNQITVTTSQSEKKRFKEILKKHYDSYYAYVLGCIKEAVSILNNYIIDLVTNHYENDVLTILQTFRTKLFEIEKEIRSRTEENITSKNPFWKSIAELDHDDDIVVLDLDDKLPFFKQISNVKRLVKETNYLNGEDTIYTLIIDIYLNIDNLNFKIRKYNLDHIKMGFYDSKTLRTDDILMILCQTDILSAKSFSEIMEFANMFNDILIGTHDTFAGLYTTPTEPPPLTHTTTASKLKNIKDYKTFDEFKSILTGENFSVLPELEWPTFFNFIQKKYVAVPTVEHGGAKNTLYIRTFETPSGIKEESDVKPEVTAIDEGEKTPLSSLSKEDSSVVKDSSVIEDSSVVPKDEGANIIKLKVSGHAPLTTDILKELTQDIQIDRQSSTYSKWLQMLNDKGIHTINDLDSMSVSDINDLNRETGSNIKPGKKGLADSIREMREKHTIERYRMGQLPPKTPSNETVSQTPYTVPPQPSLSQPNIGNAVTAAFSSALRSPASNLTDEELGRATQVFIDELVQKIGPIINNMPYGAQQTTDAVSFSHDKIYSDADKLLRQPSSSTPGVSTSGQSTATSGDDSSDEITLLKQRIEELEKRMEEHGDYVPFDEDDEDEDDEDEDEEEEDEEEENVSPKKAKAKTDVPSEGAEGAPVAEVKADVSPEEVKIPSGDEGTTSGDEGTTSGAEEKTDEKPGAESVKPGAKEPEIKVTQSDIDYLKTEIPKKRLPWLIRLTTGAIKGGAQNNEEGQKGGGNINDIPDIDQIMDCYAKRLFKLAFNPELPRTTAEINSGIVEDWFHHKNSTERKVYVEKVTVDRIKFPTTDKLHTYDVTQNSSVPVENILYIKFVNAKTSDNAIKKDNKDPKYNFSTVTGLVWGNTVNGNVTKENVHQYVQSLKQSLQKESKITTIKFMVAANGLIQLENPDGSEYKIDNYWLQQNPKDDKEFQEISKYFVEELTGISKFNFIGSSL